MHSKSNGSRHPTLSKHQQCANNKDSNCQSGCKAQSEELDNLSISPQAVVHAHQPVDNFVAAHKEKAAGYQQAVVLGKRGTAVDHHPWKDVGKCNYNNVKRNQNLFSKSLGKLCNSSR